MREANSGPSGSGHSMLMWAFMAVTVVALFIGFAFKMSGPRQPVKKSEPQSGTAQPLPPPVPKDATPIRKDPPSPVDSADHVVPPKEKSVKPPKPSPVESAAKLPAEPPKLVRETRVVVIHDAPPPHADQFAIDVFSRGNRLIECGSSFPADDAMLGLMADGDLTARIRPLGGTAPRGQLSLDWEMNRISVGPRPVSLDQPYVYNSEPGAGTYTLTLRLGKTVAATCTFRISPPVGRK